MAGYRSCRLGFDFDVGELHRDLERAVAFGWTRHFVEGNYTGDWSAIALRSVDAALGHAHSKPGVPAAAYRDTAVLDVCSSLKRVLAGFWCPVGSARLLQLAPGSVIEEHTDADLGHDSGVVRLHVPIQTRPEVEFFVEDERVPMGEGQCWYIDTSLRHRVANRSPSSRVHLVFDCELNDWLREQLAQAGFEPYQQGSLERRGVRRADLARIIEQLQTMGSPLGEQLARELEQERALHPEPAPSEAPRRAQSATPVVGAVSSWEPGWIPFDLVQDGELTLLEWRFVGNVPFTDPWLQDTVRRASACNDSAGPRRTEIDALDEAPAAGALAPAGLLFHASRTGSTLITQLLSCSPRLCVLSEPPIVESLIEWSHAGPPDARAALGRRLKAALAHLGRRRQEPEQAWLLKVESQHMLELPLFEGCFPGVPWIFLFRDPDEILASQRRLRGRQMVPGMIAAERLGVSPGAIDPAQLDAYCALMIECTFAAALSYLAQGRGRAVHYRELPEYVWRELDELFGLELTAAEEAAMRERSRRDAKHPGQLFASRTAAASTSAPLPAAQHERLRLLYERLAAQARPGSYDNLGSSGS